MATMCLQQLVAPLANDAQIDLQLNQLPPTQENLHKTNGIFINLHNSQVKANELLSGEILLDIKQCFKNPCSVVLAIECQEKVLKSEICLCTEMAMSMRNEIFRFQKGSVVLNTPGIYKMPFEVEISQFFEASECFKLDNDFSLKVDYEMSVSIVRFPEDQQKQEECTTSNHHHHHTHSNSNNKKLPDQDIQKKQSKDATDEDIEILLVSEPTPLTIINHLTAKQSEPIQAVQRLQARKRSFFQSLGSAFCCSKSPKKNKEASQYANSITQFCVNVNTINLYPGEAFAFFINDDSKLNFKAGSADSTKQELSSVEAAIDNLFKSDSKNPLQDSKSTAVKSASINFRKYSEDTNQSSPQKNAIGNNNSEGTSQKKIPEDNYQFRLVNYTCLVDTAKKTVLQKDCKVLLSHSIPKDFKEKIIIPYQSAPSYKSSAFQNWYELQIAPKGIDFDGQGCVKIPMHVNQKQLRLIPIYQPQSDALTNENEFVCKLSGKAQLVAKIQLKFDEHNQGRQDGDNNQNGDNASQNGQIPTSFNKYTLTQQKQQKHNAPVITPLKRSFE